MKPATPPHLRFPRLRRVEFECFSLFARQPNVSLAIAPGVTCLAGANGIGKSTFVIELHSRRVSIVGSTPHPDEAFMLQIARQLTDTSDGVLNGSRFLICDRDRKWSLAVRQLLETSGVRVIQTPFRAPNCNAHTERFVRSIREECLNRLIPLGERHLRHALTEFMAHYHRERNHQGLGNDLIDSVRDQHSCVDRSAAVSALVAFSATTIVRRSAISGTNSVGRIAGHYTPMA